MKTINRYLLYALVLAAFSGCNTKPHYVDISGKVIDAESGQPVVGIPVYASSFYSDNTQETDQSVVTDGNGEFIISHFRMSYKSSLIKNQKSSTLSLNASNADYLQKGTFVSSIGKHASQVYALLYVRCRAKGTFHINTNSNVYDYGVVTGMSCTPDHSECEGITAGSSQITYTFSPANVSDFSVYLMAGNSFNNVMTTKLYNSSALVKTKVDTITGLPCKTPFNYTITVS